MNRMIFPVFTAALAGGAAGYFLGRGSEGAGGEGRNVITGRIAASAAGGAHTAARENSLRGLSEPEVRTAVMRALTEPDEFQRRKLFSAILADLDETNLAAVSAVLTERWKTGADTSREGELLQICGGRVLGVKSLESYPAEPNGKVPWPTLNAMQGWASVNPREAKKWIESQEPGRSREAMEQRWLSGLASASPAVIAEIFPGLTPTQQGPLMKGVVNGLYDSGGLPAVRSWFDTLAKSGDPNAQRAVGEIVWRMARTENSAAVVTEFLLPYAKESFVTTEALRGFTREAGGKYPGECMEVIAKMSEQSPGIAAGVSELIGITIEASSGRSLNVMGDWLNSHSDHPLHDQTASIFALRTAKDDPEAARQWAAAIKNEQLKAMTLQSLGITNP